MKNKWNNDFIQSSLLMYFNADNLLSGLEEVLQFITLKRWWEEKIY